MASSRKSAPEKKTEAKKKKTEEEKKKTSKGNDTKRRKEDKKKTSNGGFTDGEVPATPSSSSYSKNDVKNGTEIIQKPTGGKNSKKDKQKAKREGKEEKEDAQLNRFPMERVRRVIRSEDSEMRVTNEAVFLVNKATEKFLEKFCEEAYKCCVQDRKKSLAYKHLSSVVSKQKRYDFLSDFVPEKVKAEDALAERKLNEPETAQELENTVMR